MKRTQNNMFIILLIILVSLAVMEGFHPEARAQQLKNTALKVALLPILDVFPFYVAQSKGYFAELGVDVRAVPVASGLERDQLMQSGAIDGMLNEMITTAPALPEEIEGTLFPMLNNLTSIHEIVNKLR